MTCGTPYILPNNVGAELTSYEVPNCECGKDDLLGIVAETPPMGVSQWKAYGKKYGYWDYFKKEILNELP